MAEDTAEAKSLVTESGSNPAIANMASLPIVRQVGVMVGLAMSVAIGVAVVLWSQTPDYSLLYANVADKDASEVMDALQQLGVDYRIDHASGAVMVASDMVHEVRLKLAAQGLPKSTSTGFELLEKETGFGTSQALEAVRFQRALEGEIARSVTAIQNVRSARVHLALPKQSVFVRQRKKPSASVLVDLYSGRTLERGQVDAIIHLVASSVPMLESEQVTVVDQRGHLLNEKDDQSALYLTGKQFDYKKQVEDHLMERVENILLPLLGRDGLKTQVTADIDFTVTEKTQEMYNPDLPALRSEHTIEQLNGSGAAQGVPGALSNQPPPAGVAPEVAGKGPASGNSERNVNSSKTATRNFELDKTVSHSRLSSGELRRVTVAVVVDDKVDFASDGSRHVREYTQEELNRFTDLVKQAIGFDMARGDRVTVSNVSFRAPEPMEPLPEIPLWEQGWFVSLLKQSGAVVVVLVLIFGVLRPVMRTLVGRNEDRETDDRSEAGQSPRLDQNGNPIREGGVSEDGLQDDMLSLGQDNGPLLLDPPKSYERRLEFAQKMVDEDPKRVAQVIKSWLG